jgi:hypothetical protein
MQSWLIWCESHQIPELAILLRIGNPAKPDRYCEIHKHKRVLSTFIICYIRMIDFMVIIQILMFYNAILFPHQFPDDCVALYYTNPTQFKTQH